jgi:hypothetical protein
MDNLEERMLEAIENDDYVTLYALAKETSDEDLAEDCRRYAKTAQDNCWGYDENKDNEHVY